MTYVIFNHAKVGFIAPFSPAHGLVMIHTDNLFTARRFPTLDEASTFLNQHRGYMEVKDTQIMDVTTAERILPR